MSAGRFDYDLVVKNEILKAQEILEEKASKEWHKKWGFYLDFDKICLEEARKRGYTEEEYRKMTVRRKPAKHMEESMWTLEPCREVPKTSTGFVGWRSGPNYSLEKFGPLYISPRHTLPYEPPYKYIILG